MIKLVTIKSFIALSCALLFISSVNAQQKIDLPQDNQTAEQNQIVIPKQQASGQKLPKAMPPIGQGAINPQQVLPGGQNLMQMLQGQGGMPGGIQGGQQSLKDMLGPGDVDEIYGPIHIVSPWLITAYVVGVIAVLMVIWLVIKYLTRPVPVVIRRYYEIAFEALNKVKASMNDVDSREFSIQISNVIRTYIEGRFEVVSTKSTTDEFMDMIRGEKHGPLKEHMDQLHDFLGYCDLAKFAGCELSDEQINGMMDSAWKFVDETKDDDVELNDSANNSSDESDVIDPEVVSKGGVA